ncbi:MAG: CDP-glucose 4,6-dehydratase [Sediminibacterium sp.]|nr:CDP-glucose 4,6-dehydratase [Sediminibacterium sp.]
MNLNIYKNKKIFVTGHTGFKGAWLSIWLKKMGAIVRGYALKPNTDKDLYNYIPHTYFEKSVISTILDKEKLALEIQSFEPDFIFHLAAQPLVRESFIYPMETFEVNIIGTGNILNSVRKLPKKCVVICITTDKVYENKEWEYPYRENDRLGGFDPYSASKAGAEIIIHSFRNAYFNVHNFLEHKKSIASVRAGNVIGGGDFSKDRLIPDIIQSIENNKNIIVRNPTAIRPWQHVLDPLSGYLKLGLMLAENNNLSGAYNFGPPPNAFLSVKELAEIAVKIYGKGNVEYPTLLNQPHEAHNLQLDISKAQHSLNWQPTFSNKEAIENTIDWYKKTESEKLSFTEMQIEQFQKKGSIKIE